MPSSKIGRAGQDRSGRRAANEPAILWTVDGSHVHAVGHAFKRMAHLCGGTWIDDDGLLLYRTATQEPMVWNGALALSSSLPAAELVTRADAFFAGERPAYGFWVLESRDAALVTALADAGAEVVSDDPHMSLELEGDEPAFASELELEVVHDDVGHQRYLQVARGSFETLGVDPGTWALVYPSVAAVAQDDIIAVVALDAGTPLAGAMAYLDGEICEVIHVGTLPSARRRGLGRVATTAVVAEARRRGATEAILQATPEGEPVYRRMGFRQIDRFRLYLRSTPTSGPTSVGS